jgi:hypothetical protein
MLRVENEHYLAEVRAFADRTGQREQLETQLRYLETFGCERGDGSIDPTLVRVRLYPDYAMSFQFGMDRKNDATGNYECWLQGGLIYHGVHDGYGAGIAPSFATTVIRMSGWVIHT